MTNSRLSIKHPDYRYIPSKNPYWAKLKDPSSPLHKLVLSDQDTELSCRGGKPWLSQFSESSPTAQESRNSKLHVEIGCNAGHVILEWARQNPQDYYIGVDWKFKMIHKAAEKALKKQLHNLIFLRAHAERLPWMFSEGEIDFLYLFFPDPWPKKAQRKNRFLTSEQLQRIGRLMKPGGIFHIKTDHAEYFAEMLEEIEQMRNNNQNPGWEVIEQTTDLHASHPAPHTLNIPEVTLFEKLFIKDKIPIKSIKLKFLMRKFKNFSEN